MRLLTLLAVAAIAAGLYQYRQRPRVSDERLARRVRSGIAGVASNPVEVRCVNAVVSLRGTLSKAERDRVLAAVLAVPGVTRVTDFLDTDEPIGDLGPMQSGIATGL